MLKKSLSVLLFSVAVTLSGNSPRQALRAGEGAAPAAKPAEAGIHLTGTGDEASQKFSLQEGFSIWHITHHGRSNVQVELLNQEGQAVGMPLNEIGRFRGTLVYRVAKAGEYLLNVKADGKWAVTIEQPRPAEAPAKPLSAEGKGSDVAPFVTLPRGLNVFKATHAGGGVFRVKLFDRDGKLVEQVFAHIGTYKGSKALSLEQEGIYAVGVYATGDWTLRIE